MRTLWFVSVLFFLLFIGPVSGQELSHLFTRPKAPPTEALDRLSLKQLWFKKVPMAGIKDGIVSVQLLPGESGDELLIQTRNGLVRLMDAETGDLKWEIPVGLPFKYFQGAAFNNHSIYVTREVRLFALNRKTGKHRLFHIETKTGFPKLGVAILNAPSATMIADEAALFIPSDNRLTGYLMPKTEELQVNLGPPMVGQVFTPGNLESSPQPKFQGTLILPDTSISQPLVMFGDAIGVYNNSGTFFSVNKYKLEERFHFKTFGTALAGIGQYGDMAYVGSADYNVYAINSISSKLRWRFLSGSPILRAPQATDADVFVTSSKLGLSRLDRDEGSLRWNNKQADLFLGVNGKFVYALDAQRFLLVLDYLKGTTLSRFDLSDFVVPYSNTLSDRIYLANHDGSVLCLRHQNFKKPYRPKSAEETGT